MKCFITILTVILFTACNQSPDHSQQLQAQIDSLQNKLDNSYKPGLGEFMSSIQVHHAKLWFAGTSNNWKLADFEINEIREALDDIQLFNTDRPEVQKIGMITPAIDSITNAIRQQSLPLFRSSYSLLTSTCNNCHQATDHAFNVIIIPSTPPVSNQSFKPE